jgi:pimeloyl-ACP methyl ester carboxylesterase
VDVTGSGVLERTVTLHGQQVAYRQVGDEGPLLVLVHGVGQSSATWDAVLDRLGTGGHQVVAIDLPGHGRSSKDRGDYSLGSLASTIRDLLDALGHERCVVVGHSLGGGVALQFAYQFPQRCDGLVLVASGGLGPEAFAPLRAATLPGAELVLPLITHRRTMAVLTWVGTALSLVGIRPEVLSPEALGTLGELADPPSRMAFLATIRGVVDVSGQRVSAVGKLPAAAHLPLLMVWGDRDRVIPLQHGVSAKELLPSSRLVVFPGAGHEPHRFDPLRFVDLLLEFVDEQQELPRSG